ncbi:hypothetical protein O6H91_10G054100 [Diphasiastrum complanatum]|uniref:Uncharacterized protein n=1 Tax=Diphasiastrum complanatum TaxID=34168 RepID=A0ACC2CH12_DIPCM|nr:hypothetical protein O6H91_10G054100 [Diphasiastrum complanatum]
MKNRKELEFINISAVQMIRLLMVPILFFYVNLVSASDDGMPLPTNDPAPRESSQPKPAPTHHDPGHGVPSPNHGSGGNSAWKIACISIGVILCATILIGVVVFICKMMRKRRHGHCGDATAQEATTA